MLFVRLFILASSLENPVNLEVSRWAINNDVEHGYHLPLLIHSIGQVPLFFFLMGSKDVDGSSKSKPK